MKKFLILIVCALGFFTANAAVKPPDKIGPEFPSYLSSEDQSPAYVIELNSVQAPESPAVCFQTIGSPDLIGQPFFYLSFTSKVNLKFITPEKGWNKRISCQSTTSNSLNDFNPVYLPRGWNKRI